MRITLGVFVDDDDALLQWSVDELDPRTRGFAIQRELRQGRRAPVTTWLENYAWPGKQPHQNGQFARSDKWPFRSFAWTDHSVGPGDTVRYRVVPVLEGEAAPSDDLATDWSAPKELGAGGVFRPFFNRGFVISQFMSRYLDEHYPGEDRDKALRALKRDLAAFDNAARAELSGQLRTALLELLHDVVAGPDHVYAALFELGDDELVAQLEALGPRAHLVLSNGSVQGKKGQPVAEARKEDENAEARARLLAADVDVERTNRFISPGALGHNKFLVVTDAKARPLRAWTGSTNWTTTGLCTQLNNGLLIEDAQVAAAYLAQWRALREAGSSHPAALSAGNGLPSLVGDASVHFTRAVGHVDLTALREIVQGAQEGVLFLMFIPGSSGVLQDLQKLAEDRPDLLVRGVVSELPKGRQDEKTGRTTTVRVRLLGTPKDRVEPPKLFDVVQPEGMTNVAGGWAVETTHSQFLADVGHAIIHSKVLVVDPLSDEPTIVTGSHNFSRSASEENDENFIVVKGDRALAEAYAVNVENAYHHYAGRVSGRTYADKTGIEFLQARLDDQRREERFWRIETGAPVRATT